MKIVGLVFIAAITSLLINACTKIEDPSGPSLMFKEGATGSNLYYISSDTLLTAGQPFMLGIMANSTSDKNLASIKLERKYEVVDIKTIINKELSTPSIDIDTLLKANSEVGTEDFVCTVTDRNNISETLHFTVITEAADPMIKRYTGLKMGSYESDESNLFSAGSGIQTTAEEATASEDLQSIIDWCYFHGVNFGHTFASPSSSITATIYANTIANWSTKRTTLFLKTPNISADEFNAIENREDLLVGLSNQNIVWSNAVAYFSENNSTPGGFEVQDIIAYKTQEGLRGLICITEIEPGYNNGESTVLIDVIVEDIQ